ncbi:MAG: YraN family protein [Bacteroidaceae bacterium]|nr:YraN family protein [Bacteroidaceae bacterium]
MAQHNIYGRSGEDVAAEYLEQQGYLILERNWFFGHKELDIVAQKDEQLVIVEVKTRRRNTYGRPEEAVTARKISCLVLAANAYVRMHFIDMPVRFDVIAISHLGEGHREKIEHYEDAFRPNAKTY